MSEQSAERASVDPLVAALFSDPAAVVTKQQVRAVARVHARVVAQVAAVEYILGEFEKAAEAAPGHAYAGPWLAMVDDIRRTLTPRDAA